MTIPRPGNGRRPIARHAAALATLLTFGCTTVRAPVSGISSTVPVHGATAEPQVELWLESAKNVTAEESARATADAREALRQALEGRTLGEDDVLVVRAQAVSRTRSHRNDQRAAVAGIVVGAVAVVALVIASGEGSWSIPAPGGRVGRGRGARGGAVALRPGSGPRVPVVPVPVPVPVPAPRGAPRAVPAPAGSRGAGGAVADVDVDVGIVVQGPDVPPAAAAEGGEPVQPAAYDPWAAPPPATAEADGPRITQVTLPPPPPLQLERRGFFDGDWLRLELMVVDARTGAVRWAKTVADDVDVRDARKVRTAVDRALAEEEGWYAPSPGAY